MNAEKLTRENVASHLQVWHLLPWQNYLGALFFLFIHSWKFLNFAQPSSYIYIFFCTFSCWSVFTSVYEAVHHPFIRPAQSDRKSLTIIHVAANSAQHQELKTPPHGCLNSEKTHKFIASFTQPAQKCSTNFRSGFDSHRLHIFFPDRKIFIDPLSNRRFINEIKESAQP